MVPIELLVLLYRSLRIYTTILVFAKAGLPSPPGRSNELVPLYLHEPPTVLICRPVSLQAYISTSLEPRDFQSLKSASRDCYLPRGD